MRIEWSFLYLFVVYAQLICSNYIHSTQGVVWGSCLYFCVVLAVPSKWRGRLCLHANPVGVCSIVWHKWVFYKLCTLQYKASTNFAGYELNFATSLHWWQAMIKMTGALIMVGTMIWFSILSKQLFYWLTLYWGSTALGKERTK